MRVLLISDQRLSREALIKLLSEDNRINALSDTDVTGAERARIDFNPDVSLFVLSQLQALCEGDLANLLKSVYPTPAVAIVDGASPEVQRSLERSGFQGLAASSSGFEALGTALSEVARGGRCFPIHSYAIAKDQDPIGPDALTTRELEVLSHVADGHSSPQIARTIGVTVSTVETHRKNIVRKLRIRSVAGLTKFAIRHGLTGLA